MTIKICLQPLNDSLLFFKVIFGAADCNKIIIILWVIKGNKNLKVLWPGHFTYICATITAMCASPVGFYLKMDGFIAPNFFEKDKEHFRTCLVLQYFRC